MAYPPQGRMAVIGIPYCLPHTMELVVTEKAFSFSGGDYTVTDSHGGAVFRVEGKFWSSRDRRVLVDNAGNPIVSMKRKLWSSHDRWKVFRGDSSDERNLLFSVKRSSWMQWKTKLHVFLAGNTQERTCDFKIKGSFFERSCTIYLGDSDTIVAQMHKKYKIANMILGKDTFGVTVYPNVDYAFIVSLIVILHGLHEEN